MIRSNHGFSPSPCDLGEPLSVEQDAMNEVQGLLVGLELLNEVEGHGTFSCVTLTASKGHRTNHLLYRR